MSQDDFFAQIGVEPPGPVDSPPPTRRDRKRSEFDIFYRDASLQPLTFVIGSDRRKYTALVQIALEVAGAQATNSHQQNGTGWKRQQYADKAE